MQEIHLKIRYFEREFSTSFKKFNFIFFEPIPFYSPDRLRRAIARARLGTRLNESRRVIDNTPRSFS